ncbi:ASPARTYL PROTEASE AED3 [Salix viminalis]|uniref:ASPARTYL PROTEASE AED3 n=1 Tax=Salix viminalis TaxID=40686 RepID=A0A9Q0UI37_SALVM|nr:ASPARTYL PROTEASE AED3 [Salix viminalis]
MDFTHSAAAFFLLALLFSTAKAIDPCAAQSDGSDLSVIPIYGKCSPFVPPKQDSWVDTVITMASKDPERLKYLSTLAAQKTTAVPIAPGQQVLHTANYVGCAGCSSTTFSPNASTTLGSLDCSGAQCSQVRGFSCPATGSSTCLFNQSYGGDSSLSATLVQDAITLASDVIPGFTFGCINAVSGGSIPPQGLLGLGRGPISLLSQAGPIYSGVFSYCLPSFKNYYFSGSLKLGPAGQPKSIRTTPLLRNPHRPSLYYVNLTGVSVGRIRVPIPPEQLVFDPNTGAGTIIDSGTVITRFVQPVYLAIRDEFRKQVNGPFSSLGAFDTCFAATNEAEAPAVTLHFSGLSLVLPMENSLIHSSSGSLACLSMAAAPNNVNSVLNVIANLQQQNLRIMFDTINSRLGIARELCN